MTAEASSSSATPIPDSGASLPVDGQRALVRTPTTVHSVSATAAAAMHQHNAIFVDARPGKLHALERIQGSVSYVGPPASLPPELKALVEPWNEDSKADGDADVWMGHSQPEATTVSASLSPSSQTNTRDHAQKRPPSSTTPSETPCHSDRNSNSGDEDFPQQSPSAMPAQPPKAALHPFSGTTTRMGPSTTVVVYDAGSTCMSQSFSRSANVIRALKEASPFNLRLCFLSGGLPALRMVAPVLVEDCVMPSSRSSEPRRYSARGDGDEARESGDEPSLGSTGSNRGLPTTEDSRNVSIEPASAHSVLRAKLAAQPGWVRNALEESLSRSTRYSAAVSALSSTPGMSESGEPASTTTLDAHSIVTPPAAVLPWLLVGDVGHARNVPKLQLAGVTRVMTIAAEVAVDYEEGTFDEVLQIPAEDRSDFDLRKMLPEACAFLARVEREWMTQVQAESGTVDGNADSDNSRRTSEQGSDSCEDSKHNQEPSQQSQADEQRVLTRRRTQRGKVLVHCYAGNSRSVTVVVAYLIQSRGISVAEALELVRETRRTAAPNSGFMQQLGDWEREVRESRCSKRPLRILTA